MKRLLILAIAIPIFLLPATLSLAKRNAPESVSSVSKDGIEYSAPSDREGFVVAKWLKTNQEIWSRQVYVIKHEYKYGLEADVQTCFITLLEFGAGTLRVKNERGSEFELDLDTLNVKVLKGHNVIDFTKRAPAIGHQGR